MQYSIRTMKKPEYPLLCDFLYEAIYIPEGVEPPPKTVINCPELQEYICGFGDRKRDKALVAEFSGQVIGVVWARIMQDYGHIDDETPSLAISLYPAYRGQGVGSALLKAMLKLLQHEGYAKVSLSVQKANDAVRLYQKLGFKIWDESTEEYRMVRCFESVPKD